MIVKSPCQQCGTNIEFDAEHANTFVTCPACSQQTRLIIQRQTYAALQYGGLASFTPTLLVVGASKYPLANISSWRAEKITSNPVKAVLTLLFGLIFIVAGCLDLDVGFGYVLIFIGLSIAIPACVSISRTGTIYALFITTSGGESRAVASRNPQDIIGIEQELSRLISSKAH